MTIFIDFRAISLRSMGDLPCMMVMDAVLVTGRARCSIGICPVGRQAAKMRLRCRLLAWEGDRCGEKDANWRATLNKGAPIAIAWHALWRIICPPIICSRHER